MHKIELMRFEQKNSVFLPTNGHRARIRASNCSDLSLCVSYRGVLIYKANVKVHIDQDQNCWEKN